MDADEHGWKRYLKERILREIEDFFKFSVFPFPIRVYPRSSVVQKAFDFAILRHKNKS
jgi:hypothetical protein